MESAQQSFRKTKMSTIVRGEMEEYILSLRSHSDYYDNGLILTMKNKLIVHLMKLLNQIEDEQILWCTND